MALERDVADLAQLRALVERTRPVTGAEQRTLAVTPAFEALLPGAALRRGSFVQVDGGAGATSLALALAAGPSRAGSWVAVLGAEDLGWGAAAELGVDLDRVAVVDADGDAWLNAVAALVDAFDVVMVATRRRPDAARARRLRARARERGAVLILLPLHVSGKVPERAAHWHEAPDVHLRVVDAEWSGLGQGWGRLRSRRLTVAVDGRHGAAVPKQVELWLPDSNGRVAPVESTPAAAGRPAADPAAAGPTDGRPAVVRPLRRVG